jgi:hypothetical protein
MAKETGSTYFFNKTGSGYVAQAGLELETLLSQSPKEETTF